MNFSNSFFEIVILFRKSSDWLGIFFFGRFVMEDLYGEEKN